VAGPGTETDIPTADSAVGSPARPLAPFVHRYIGYRYLGFRPGTHLGLPTRHLTVVVALGPPTRLSGMPDPRQEPGEFRMLASGLAARPAVIAHDGNQFGVQLDLTPAGARGLLGLPAGELAEIVVDLEDLVGPAAPELLERMAAATSWPDRFAVLDQVLERRLGVLPPAEAPLRRAWHLLVRSGGSLRVDRLADEVGWSRRHLSARFSGEFGLSPKELARVVRFERSKLLIQRGRWQTLADVAATCGYYDQAHLTREWSRLAGCPPSVWLAEEELPNVQDGTKPSAETSES
jgi:AraC-like DNA-binding protein